MGVGTITNYTCVTEGNGNYFGSANLPFSFSLASLALSAVPQEWSGSKHRFHSAWLSSSIVLCIYTICSDIYCRK